MTAKGHIVISIPIAAASLYYAESFNFIEKLTHLNVALFYIASLFGSLLPDIDEPESYIGKRIPIFSNVLSIFIEHRGITHYLIVPLFLLTLAYFEDDLLVKPILFGLGVGVFAHTVGDMLTKGGIRGYLFPFFRKRTFVLLPWFLRFYTNSITEYLYISFFICLILLSFLNYPFIYLR
jgi:inner membrane protein